MPGSELEFSIAIPLEKWNKNIPLEFTRLIDFCRLKSTEIRRKETPKLSNDIVGSIHLVPRADMYNFCTELLIMARDLTATVVDVQTAKKYTTFTFKFATKKYYNFFYAKVRGLCISYHMVDPSVEQIKNVS